MSIPLAIRKFHLPPALYRGFAIQLDFLCIWGANPMSSPQGIQSHQKNGCLPTGQAGPIKVLGHDGERLVVWEDYIDTTISSL